MNKQDYDVLMELVLHSYKNQRNLSMCCGYSLGTINQSLKRLLDENFVDACWQLTEKAKQELTKCKPKNAIILAAGTGIRMVPINTMTPKALIEVKGEPLIERIIKQLNCNGIFDIYVVVGFMKEQFEYLIDEYGVHLITNDEYATKNNLHSIELALQHISNSYIIPCDIWCEDNPFRPYEFYSWYMVSNQLNSDSQIRVNRKQELIVSPNASIGNRLIGISYLQEDQAEFVRKRIRDLSVSRRNDSLFWEEALYNADRMIIPARIVDGTKFKEINTYEQLRDLDQDSCHLKADAIVVIKKALNCTEHEISNISILKKGMTNRSFLFSVRGKKYIMRIPGEGTDQLINRTHEASVYSAISSKNICDNIIYINPQNGYKISEFVDGVRVCDPLNIDDITICMEKLRQIHEMNLIVDHQFDIFKQIEFYENLRNGEPSVYRDYEKTKQLVYTLKEYINSHVEKRTLTHIDAVPDNFIFLKTEVGEDVRLIDWEYAGMQDPHVDIAMFCIYSLYDKAQIDRLIDIYFNGQCSKEVRIKIYCYISACGLLWSNWCEHKRSLGQEFGEYSLRQYRYAKEYYKIAMDAQHI